MTQQELKTTSNDNTLEKYFPSIDILIEPQSDWCIVQMKKSSIEEKTAGGIILTNAKSADEKNQEEWHETWGRVVAIGPLFQRNRTSLELWPEFKAGGEAKIGDIYRIPEFVAGRFTVKTDSGDEIKCIFIRDTQLMGKAIDSLKAINTIKSYIPISQRKV